MTILEALRQALASLPVMPQDVAAVALAERYAAELDGPGADLAKLGPPFLSVLTALSMTPAGRASILGKGGDRGGSSGGSKLDELRERRSRKRDAAAVD